MSKTEARKRIYAGMTWGELRRIIESAPQRSPYQKSVVNPAFAHATAVDMLKDVGVGRPADQPIVATGRATDVLSATNALRTFT